MRRFLAPLALGMVALYLTLAVGAAGCLFDPVQSSVPAHHHHSHVTHSAFCAWACQANPTVSGLVEALPAVVFRLVVLLILVWTSMSVRLTAHEGHSRAPPR